MNTILLSYAQVLSVQKPFPAKERITDKLSVFLQKYSLGNFLNRRNFQWLPVIFFFILHVPSVLKSIKGVYITEMRMAIYSYFRSLQIHMNTLIV